MQNGDRLVAALAVLVAVSHLNSPMKTRPFWPEFLQKFLRLPVATSGVARANRSRDMHPSAGSELLDWSAIATRSGVGRTIVLGVGSFAPGTAGTAGKRHLTH
jgi:hypothetical protein